MGVENCQGSKIPTLTTAYMTSEARQNHYFVKLDLDYKYIDKTHF